MDAPLDINLKKHRCPHCGEPASEVTNVSVGTWSLRGPDATIPTIVSVWIRYECGGETGYEFSDKGMEQIDGDIPDSVCPLKDVDREDDR